MRKLFAAWAAAPTGTPKALSSGVPGVPGVPGVGEPQNPATGSGAAIGTPVAAPRVLCVPASGEDATAGWTTPLIAGGTPGTRSGNRRVPAPVTEESAENQGYPATGTPGTPGTPGTGPGETEALSDEWPRLHHSRIAFWRAMKRDKPEHIAWGELQVRWQALHPLPLPLDDCAGCGLTLDDAETFDMGGGLIVHVDGECLVAAGRRWRTRATGALRHMGLTPPAGLQD